MWTFANGFLSVILNWNLSRVLYAPSTSAQDNCLCTQTSFLDEFYQHCRNTSTQQGWVSSASIMQLPAWALALVIISKLAFSLTSHFHCNLYSPASNYGSLPWQSVVSPVMLWYMALNETKRIKSAPVMKTNAKFSKARKQRAEPRTVTDAISIFIYLHLAKPQVVSSGKGVCDHTKYQHTVSLYTDTMQCSAMLCL